MSAFDAIRRAAQNLHLVEMTYEKVNGEVKDYTIEPYSLRDGKYLFGYDVNECKIKKYVVVNIMSAEETDTEFSPRWDVEL